MSGEAFSVGLQIYIEKNLGEKNVKYLAKIIGWENGAYIIISSPAASGQPMDWQPGTPCTVKFFNNGKIFLFKTILLEKQQKPMVLGFIKFPQKIEEVELRKHKRIQTFLLCMVSRQGEPAPIQGTILDLSRGGGLIELPHVSNAVVGEKIKLSFMLPNGTKIDNLCAEIKNVAQEADKVKLGTLFYDENREPFLKVDLFFKRLEMPASGTG